MNERRSELVKETEGTVMINEEMIERAAKAIRSTADAFFNGREVDQITSVKSAKQAFDRLYRQQARAALQAAAVEPEPGLSLDAVEAMLDDPNVVSALGRSFAQRRNGEADYDSRPSYRSYCDGEGISEVEAALAVMREVQNTVRQ